ncbi:MAG: GNAT family N-acetyltransferase [Deltaproteobacteria bacterium]|jgi:acyl-CoA hydrolase/GNAT superfamily N-acetyltransferase|nr:GNAT family N-acetyltransferase [Deltaproteobacteria bacterium]
MEHWKKRFASKLVSADEAASHVKNGDRIYLGSFCSEPRTMIRALGASAALDIEMIQFLNGKESESLARSDSGRFSLKTFFVGRKRSGWGRWSESDYVPLFHSQIPDFFRRRRIPIDMAIVQVSEPDRFGRFSLGISVDISMAAVQAARMVIAQVNCFMPRTLGDTFIPVDKINYLVEADEELTELPEEPFGDRERTISRYCSELIEDGSVLQFGFAGISRGLMDFMTEHRHLGLHTEVFSDPLVDLIEAGVVDNSTKKLYRGKSLATCCIGTRRAYDYVHDNSLVEFYPSDFCLNPAFIGSNDKMIAVNLALQVDLRGQIRQGSPTWTSFEGSGGDHDFMRGAGLSKDGRSIVCLTSSSEGIRRSNIVASFGTRAAAMMNRGDTNYIITEYGIAYLGGKSVRERSLALIEIAHPDHREDLMRKAREMGYVYPDQFYYRMASPELRARVRKDHAFKNGLIAHVRAIKLTDEPMIRDLFYHLSESSVYFRYFNPRKSMPHENLQEYVSVTEEQGLSIVVTVGPRENLRFIAESRYLLQPDKELADVSFMVDEQFHGYGIATFLLNYMIEIAKERGVKGFTADVLASNLSMIKVFDKVPYVQHKKFGQGIISLVFRFDELKKT